MADLFQTVNGQQTIATMLAGLQQAGYGGPTDPLSVIQAYQHTTNGGVTPMGAQPVSSPVVNGSGGGSSSSGTSSDQQAILDAFKASSGFSIQDLAEKKREFDAGLQQKQLEWQRQGLPQLVIQQRSQALAEDEFNFQKQLAEQNIDLQRGNLGLDYLKTASSMGGPADFFQEDDFLRGAQQRGDVPQFLKALADNTQLGYSPTGNAPTPLTADNLAARLDGSSGAAGAPAGGGVASSGSSPLLTSLFGPSVPGSALASAPSMTDPNSLAALSAGPLNQFGTTGAGAGSTTTAVAPGQSGPTTPENRSFGIGPASQDFGNGPGQGGIDVSGQRGLSTPTTTGFNLGDALRFNFAALTGKAPGSYIQLQDKNTGQVVGQSAVQGTNQPVTMTLLQQMDPTHQYHIFTVYPSEGGATAGIDFSPSELAIDNSVQGQAAAKAVRDFWYSPAGNVDNRAYAGNDVFDKALSAAVPTTPAVATTPAPAAPTTPAVSTTPAVPTAPAASATNPTGTNTDATLNAFANVFKAGGSALAPGEIEQLNPDELALMGSAAQKLGFSMPSFLASYGQSRIGQSSGQAA